MHIKNTTVYKQSEDDFNIKYTVMLDAWVNTKHKKEYILIKDTDFHVMDKHNFMEIM